MNLVLAGRQPPKELKSVEVENFAIVCGRDGGSQNRGASLLSDLEAANAMGMDNTSELLPATRVSAPIQETGAQLDWVVKCQHAGWSSRLSH